MVSIRPKKQTYTTLKVPTEIRQCHIEEGKCRDPNLCMEKLGIHEALIRAFGPNAVIEHARIDSTGIKFKLRRLPLGRR
jgi:hypothetical protein